MCVGAEIVPRYDVSSTKCIVHALLHGLYIVSGLMPVTGFLTLSAPYDGTCLQDILELNSKMYI